MRELSCVVLAVLVMTLGITSPVSAQGLPAGPYSAPSVLRREGPNPAPPSSFDRSHAEGNFLTSSGTYLNGASTQKGVPDLQTGYVYYAGKNWRAGYFTLDYLLPIKVGENGTAFGEAHSEFQTLSNDGRRQGDDQVYFSMGGGYRTLLGGKTLIGINGFYDAARFSNRWVSSGGAGFEMAALLPGHDAIDINFNWYGDLSRNDSLVTESRDGPANFDLQAGYSHRLFDRGPDLRLFGTAYKFDDGGGTYGWQTGAELKTSDGVLSAKFATACDPVNNSYQTISAFVNIGFEMENLLKGRNPFVMPEPLFNSPRNISRVADKVKRHWRHTTYGVSLASNNQTITVVNNRSAPVTLYMGFIGSIGWGKYSAKDFPGFSVAPPSCNQAGNVLYRTMQPGEQVVISFDPNKGQVSPAFSADQCTWNCPQTIAEFTLQGYAAQDITDISLVNGFNYPMELKSSSTNVPTIRMDGATGNKNKYGVFPRYCDLCNASQKPGCPVPPDQSECSPNNQCHVWQPAGANYTLSILQN